MASFFTKGPRVPQEIVDHIVDDVDAYPGDYDRVRALASCTLTCQAWLPRASKHLLKRVLFTKGEELQPFLEMAGQSRRLTNNIREIFFRGLYAEDVAELLDYGQALSDCLPLFNRLRIWDSPSVPLPRGHGLTLKPVSQIEPWRFNGHLELCGSHSRYFCSVLRTFTHIDTLTIKDVSLRREDLPTAFLEEHVPVLSLNSLVLSDRQDPTAVWFIGKMVQRLTSYVALLDIRGDTVTTIWDLLREKGQEIEYFCLRPNRAHGVYYSIFTEFASIQLLQFERLQFVDLDCIAASISNDPLGMRIAVESDSSWGQRDRERFSRPSSAPKSPFGKLVRELLTILPRRLSRLRLAVEYTKLNMFLDALPSPLAANCNVERVELHIVCHALVRPRQRQKSLRAEQDGFKHKIPKEFTTIHACDHSDPLHRDAHQYCPRL